MNPCREATIELVKAVRAWCEYAGPRHSGNNEPNRAWITVQHRLDSALRAFTAPYADDMFAESGVIVSACTSTAVVFLCPADLGARHPDSDTGSCHD